MAKQTSPGQSGAAQKRKRASEAPPPVSQVILKPQLPVEKPQLPVEKPQPTHEEIAARAFSLYQARGGSGGDPENDWLRAEQELTN